MQNHWIQTAIKHHGAATRAASAAGMSVQQWAHANQHAPGVTGKRARLAITLHELHHHDQGHSRMEAAMG